MIFVICVTAMLHNIAAKAGVALFEPEDIEDEDDEEDWCEDGLPHNYAAGFHARRRVIDFFLTPSTLPHVTQHSRQRDQSPPYPSLWPAPLLVFYKNI